MPPAASALIEAWEKANQKTSIIFIDTQPNLG